MPIAAGRLRHRVEILRRTKQPTGKGGFTTDWGVVGSFRAEVKSLSGREAMIEHVLQDVRAYRISARWRDDVRTEDQLRLKDGRLLNIRSADDPDGRRRDLVIIADTQATTGA